MPKMPVYCPACGDRKMIARPLSSTYYKNKLIVVGPSDAPNVFEYFGVDQATGLRALVRESAPGIPGSVATWVTPSDFSTNYEQLVMPD